MRTAQYLLAQAKRLCVTISRSGERLRVEPKSVISQEFLACLAANKVDVLALLDLENEAANRDEEPGFAEPSDWDPVEASVTVNACMEALQDKYRPERHGPFTMHAFDDALGHAFRHKNLPEVRRLCHELVRGILLKKREGCEP